MNGTTDRPDVVLVDSGVSAEHPHVAERGGATSIGGVDASGAFDPSIDGLRDVLGHGTAAAAAILDLAPGLRLGSIRVFTDAPAAPFPHLLAALSAAVALRPRFVALPLGSPRSDWDDALLRTLADAAEAGTTVVAPASYGGLACRPGCLPGATGVLEDPALDRAAPVFRTAADGRGFWYASPFPREAPGVARHRNFRGPSFAAANLVGFLAGRLRSEVPSRPV